MPETYKYSLDQCDVPKERRSALESYRDKRRDWIAWLDEDKDHAIWTTLSQMVWNDVAFRTLAELAINNPNGCLGNSLITEKLINGHVATQVLAVRRLVDKTRGVISLRRLLTDVRSNFNLFTRENYVCHDGLPFDYEPIMQKEAEEKVGKGPIWVETAGPDAWGTSQMAHAQFDRLAGISAADRRRGDRLPIKLLDCIEGWLDGSEAKNLAEWSHAYLAHAGSRLTRAQMAELTVTNNKISDTIRILARATEALSAYFLYAGGRLNSLMPVAQFDQFEKLDQPAMSAGQEDSIGQFWDRLSSERDGCLGDVRDELVRCASSTNATA